VVSACSAGYCSWTQLGLSHWPLSGCAGATRRGVTPLPEGRLVAFLGLKTGEILVSTLAATALSAVRKS